MFQNNKKLIFTFVLILTALVCAVTAGFADKVEKYIPDSGVAEEGMTLWQIIMSGGEVMIVLAALSIAAFALVINYFMTISPEKLIPEGFCEKIVSLVKAKKFEEAKILCEGGNNLIADVVAAGLSLRRYDKTAIEEAMKDNGKLRISAIWHKLSYLADIAAIAPMVGLLGTVLGMIQAFNVIAFQTGAVKPILLASGISKAMVTTAAGLILAIPAMMFYSYFRGVAQNVTSRIGHISSEILELIVDDIRTARSPYSTLGLKPQGSSGKRSKRSKGMREEDLS